MHYNLKDICKTKNLRSKIARFLSKCEICKAVGGPNSITKNKVIASNGENELWECDLVGPLESTDKRTKYIFVAVDHFSKWIETAVLDTKEPKNICEAVTRNILNKHGIPQKILTDNGTEFKNKMTAELTSKYGFTWVYNSPGNHQTMGAVERVNKSFFDKLRKLNWYSSDKWEEQVANATFAQNISYHRGLRASPYVFKYGRMPNILDKQLGEHRDKTYTRDELLNNRNSNIDNYNKKDIEKGKKDIKEKYKPGDKVLVYKEKMQGKFETNWHEGYVIVKDLGNDAYVVSKDGKYYRVYARFLQRGYF